MSTDNKDFVFQAGGMYWSGSGSGCAVYYFFTSWQVAEVLRSSVDHPSPMIFDIVANRIES